MIDLTFLDLIKVTLLNIASSGKYGRFDCKDFTLYDKNELAEKVFESLVRIRGLVSALELARANADDDAVRAIMILLSETAKPVSNYFNDIVKDSERLIVDATWKDMADNYDFSGVYVDKYLEKIGDGDEYSLSRFWEPYKVSGRGSD